MMVARAGFLGNLGLEVDEAFLEKVFSLQVRLLRAGLRACEAERGRDHAGLRLRHFLAAEGRGGGQGGVRRPAL